MKELTAKIDQFVRRIDIDATLKKYEKMIPTGIVLFLLFFSIPLSIRNHVVYTKPGYYYDAPNEDVYYVYYDNLCSYENDEWIKLAGDVQTVETFDYLNSMQINDMHIAEFKDSILYQQLCVGLPKLDLNSVVSKYKFSLLENFDNTVQHNLENATERN